MIIEKWQRLASRYLVQEKWATLRVDELKLPNGTIKDDYFVLEYSNWATAIALTEDGKMILVRQYRHAGDIISLELPGGVLDGDEGGEAGVRRELIEETGFSFKTCKLIATLYPNPATANNQTFTYFLTGGVKTHEQHLDEHEILNVEEYTVDEVKTLLKENKIAQCIHVAALYYGLAEIEKMK
ncbi:NUDIX hydrolase [Pedobacter sandarakinus]|uniref:NUDIX hydrolase n=1 Tax=Pedobacter sandarakinus TaxID=353156 RepID=UPI002247FE1E|nr:NUDIX hydrolase [Pedobacter sandarakinus]MCX2576278.1 NUDIX hydrolase [Pedobacter sandarakinus]